MVRRSFFFFLVLTLVFPFCVFSQQASATSSLRDYVGLINQSYHPGIVAFFEKIKAELTKSGNTDAVKAVDIFLRGATGSGFVYSDARGNLYVITNNHVIAQAYSLSITFERQDGFKKKYENLKVIAADEENDIALLAFAAGDKPVARGLTFLARPIEEGEDVYSAGFPGLGVTPIWQFGRGMVSNASARFPKSFDDETLMGPFIQHTAEIDPGNSGGPLLVAQRNAPGGYVVAGINTLKAARRQAANYAIPVNTIQTFLGSALNPKPETYKAALDSRLAKFVEGLGANKAVYPHIAEYLSSACVGENAEYAIEEMYEKSNQSSRAAFTRKLEDGVVEAMGYAVAWTIENSIRSQGAIKASIKEVTGAGEEYTVVFTINNKDHTSKWVREYGNWRIRSFGAVAAGDKSLLDKKQAKKETEKKLRTDSSIHLEAGYAYLFDKAPAALYVSAELMSYVTIKLYFAGPDFFAIGGAVGYRFDFPVGNIALMPYIRLGFDYQSDKQYKDWESNLGSLSMGFPIAINGQLGIKVTSTYVPGLFLGAGFQYNLFGMHDSSYDKKKLMKMALAITAGYAF
jgi:serine protease Do